MTKEAAELLKRALTLPVSERADLAGSVAAAWDEEVVRRMADIDSGSVKPVALEDARRRISSALE
jgi:hypothetical protein